MREERGGAPWWVRKLLVLKLGVMKCIAICDGEAVAPRAVAVGRGPDRVRGVKLSFFPSSNFMSFLLPVLAARVGGLMRRNRVQSVHSVSPLQSNSFFPMS